MLAHFINTHVDLGEHAAIGERNVRTRVTGVINRNNLRGVHKCLLACFRAIAPVLNLKKSHVQSPGVAELRAY